MQKNDETLISHIEALRSVLIKCFLALSFFLLPMYALAPHVIDVLIKIMIGENELKLHFFSPMEVFILQIKVAVLLDVLVCFPYLAKQIWNFVLPALYDNERRFIKSIEEAMKCAENP